MFITSSNDKFVAQSGDLKNPATGKIEWMYSYTLSKSSGDMDIVYVYLGRSDYPEYYLARRNNIWIDGKWNVTGVCKSASNLGTDESPNFDSPFDQAISDKEMHVKGAFVVASATLDTVPISILNPGLGNMPVPTITISFIDSLGRQVGICKSVEVGGAQFYLGVPKLQ